MQGFRTSAALIFYSKTSDCFLWIDSLSSKTQLWFYFWILWPTFDYQICLVPAVIFNLHVTAIPNKSESLWVLLNISTVAAAAPATSIWRFPSVLILTLWQRERQSFSRVVWSLSIPVKSPKCPSRCCIINSQTAVEFSEVSSHSSNPSCSIGSCIFSNAHDTIGASNVPYVIIVI